MNKKKIIKAIRESVLENSYKDPIIEGVTITEEEREGGEGQGEHYYVVHKVTDGANTFYVMTTAHYDSWNGADFSYGETSEVEPYEKTIRDWREVN